MFKILKLVICVSMAAPVFSAENEIVIVKPEEKEQINIELGNQN